MRVLLALALAVPLLGAPPGSPGGRTALAATPAATVLPGQPLARPAGDQVPESSKIWLGRHAEFEEALRSAVIERIEDIGTGVTRPKRAFFVPGSLAGSAIVKGIDEGPMAPYFDTYKAEIAAYELDRLLDLDMIPPTVVRRIDGDRRSVQLWVENTRSLKKVAGLPIPDREAWNHQIYRMRVFDNLIVNIDRNERNVLIDGAWNIILIDHSRAFDGRMSRVIYDMPRIDRAFLERLDLLDKATLKERLGPWLRFGVDPILAQRDRILAHFAKLVEERGEANVIIG